VFSGALEAVEGKETSVLAVAHKDLALAVTVRLGFILLVVLVIAGVLWARRRGPR
jgi:hypothetical protein